MLILSRKVDESIVIGSGENAIRVTVLKIHAGSVRVGVKAPPSVSVVRTELLDNAPPDRPPQE